jgi:hypothetical protein
MVFVFPMSSEPLTLITFLSTLVETLAQRTVDDALLTLAEGHFKVAVANALLHMGCELQEGSYASRQDKGVKIALADFVKMEGERFCWRRGDRVLSLDAGSTDVTVVCPTQLQLELKTRPDFGSKSQAQHNEIVADIDRVSTTAGVAFLFVFDEKIYRSFSGKKTETRGAPSKFSEELATLFPPIQSIAENTPITNRDRAWRSRDLLLACYRQDLPTGIHRIFVAGVRAEQSLAAESR